MITKEWGSEELVGINQKILLGKSNEKVSYFE
jgi:hypothetical protein